MGKWAGTFTCFPDKGEFLQLDTADEDVEDAVVTRERVALDWDDGFGVKYHSELLPGQMNGFEIWRGDIKCVTDQSRCGEMSGVRYDVKDGRVILIVNWELYGIRGSGMYELWKK